MSQGNLIVACDFGTIGPRNAAEYILVQVLRVMP